MKIFTPFAICLTLSFSIPSSLTAQSTSLQDLAGGLADQSNATTEGRLQQVDQSQADIGVIHRESNESISLAEVRRLNAMDLARYHASRYPRAGRSEGICGPGCSCGMVGVLGVHIVSQFKTFAETESR